LTSRGWAVLGGARPAWFDFLAAPLEVLAPAHFPRSRPATMIANGRCATYDDPDAIANPGGAS